MLAVLSSGYDLPRLAWLLENLPLEIAGRVRTSPAASPPPSACPGSSPARPAASPPASAAGFATSTRRSRSRQRAEPPRVR